MARALHRPAPDLDAAYSSAVYRITFAGRARTFGLALRALGGSVNLSDFPEPWIMMTAWNPESIPLARDENDRRTAALRQELEASGASFFPSEAGDHAGGHTEPGFLITPVSRGPALDLARRYGQRAVVLGDRGQVGLLYAATERWVVLAPRPPRDPKTE